MFLDLHIDMNKIEKKVWRQQRQDAGLCRECSSHVASASKTFCEIHLARNKKYQLKALHTPAGKYRNLKSGAKTRGIPFNITCEDFLEWLQSQPHKCHYCGIDEPLLASQADKKKRRLTVDRMDNGKGYEIENMCLACYRCNHFKSDFFKYEEWMRIAKDYISPRLNEYHTIDRKYQDPSDALPNPVSIRCCL